MTAYYNEIDPYAAQWLRNLIDAGLIAAGEVDERSIEDVLPNELAGFTQCHFFAGLGAWSLALRLAGWPDDREVWTGSCPCQPFSAAGKGDGFADERHLWPAWLHLIGERRPPAVFGEQVAGADAQPWIDLVHDDMEAVGYAFGACPAPASGFGAPHIRDRLYWMADANIGAGSQGRSDFRRRAAGGHAQPWAGSGSSGLPVGLAHGDEHGRCALSLNRRDYAEHNAQSRGEPGRLDNADNAGPQGHGGSSAPRAGLDDRLWLTSGSAWAPGQHGHAGPVNGAWRDADWLLCTDARWRPVEPGTFPLAHGLTARVGRLRAYGNAIVPQEAAEMIRTFMDHQAIREAP